MREAIMKIRKMVLPQLETVFSYMIIPSIGVWIFNRLGVRAPALPGVIGVSFCRYCKHPVSVKNKPFVHV